MINSMSVWYQEIRIPSALKSRALTALQQVPRPECLSLTDPAFVHAATLEQALACFRWRAVVHHVTEDIIGLNFVGGEAGPSALLFHVLAPYIEADSFLVCETEDGTRWQWTFNGFTVQSIDLGGFTRDKGTCWLDPAMTPGP